MGQSVLSWMQEAHFFPFLLDETSGIRHQSLFMLDDGVLYQKCIWTLQIRTFTSVSLILLNLFQTSVMLSWHLGKVRQLLFLCLQRGSTILGAHREDYSDSDSSWHWWEVQEAPCDGVLTLHNTRRPQYSHWSMTLMDIWLMAVKMRKEMRNHCQLEGCQWQLLLSPANSAAVHPVQHWVFLFALVDAALLLWAGASVLCVLCVGATSNLPTGSSNNR